MTGSSFATMVIPSEYALVAGALSGTAFVNFWIAMLVNRARKAAKIPYPNAYATAEHAEKDPRAKIFNCTVRAHANYLEALPVILVTTAITGVRYPIFAASALAAWLVGRVLYTIGYTTGDPSKRLYGAPLVCLTPFIISSSTPNNAELLSDLWTDARAQRQLRHVFLENLQQLVNLARTFRHCSTKCILSLPCRLRVV